MTLPLFHPFIIQVIMPEIKKLKTTTVFNITRPYIEILTYYDKGGEVDFLSFFISNFERVMEGVNVGIGDLIMRSFGDVVDNFYVDENGNLIVDSDNPDQYYISELDGTLIRDI